MKRRSVYWVIAQHDIDERCRRKIKLLQKLNINTITVSDFDSLRERFRERRTTTVIISDSFPKSTLIKNLKQICNLPEFLAVRFILSISSIQNDLIQTAVQLGFRDLIPIDLPGQTWTEKFEFATSTQDSVFVPPVPQMTLRNMCSVNLPVRIVWISQNEIHVEARLKVKKGDRLKLKSGIAKAMGVKWLSLKVLEHHTTNLRYRHSDAYTCAWTTSKNAEESKKAFEDTGFLSELTTDAPYRAFIAMSNKTVREELVKRLSPLELDINVVLQRHSIHLEPKFLNPQAVFIEESLTLGKNSEIFDKMLKNTAKTIPIYIIGEQAKAENYQSYPPKVEQQFVYVNRFTPGFPDSVLSRLKRGMKNPSDTARYYIPKDHELSFAELVLSARLMKVHPYCMEIALSVSLPSYGMVGIKSPIFKGIMDRICYGKVSNNFYQEKPEITNFPFLATIHLSDLMTSDRHALAKRIGDLFEKHFFPEYQRPKPKPAAELEQQPTTSDPFPSIQNSQQNEEQPTTLFVPHPQQAEDDILIHSFERDQLKEARRSPVVETSPSKEIPISQVVKRKQSKSKAKRAQKIRKDMMVLALVVCLIAAFYFLLVQYRPPESSQGKIFSEQILKFQQRFEKQE